MPHSLRAKLSGLRYKKIISDKDYDRLCKALDNENVLDKIRSEIEQKARPNELVWRGSGKSIRYGLCMALEIIDKYRGE